MIDKEKIQLAIDNENCTCIGLLCDNCPIHEVEIFYSASCGKKRKHLGRHVDYGLRPRVIRIMKEWMEENK